MEKVLQEHVWAHFYGTHTVQMAKIHLDVALIACHF